ncbi:MAG TPA: AMP-binding protein, partial [Polyangiales bacterium]|nr:AMP-binding protein [Polyangiales bacterium]
MSFVAEILAAAERRDTRPLLIEVHGRRQLPTSGRTLLAKVAHARAALAKRGIAPGDRVGLLGPNSADWVALDLAILAQGAICVPLYSRQAPIQLAAMLRDAEATLLIVSDGALLASIEPHLPSGCSLVRYEALFAQEDAVAVAGAAESSADEPITIIYTSGTSGEPKGVMLSARNVDFMLDVTVERIGRMT